MKLKERVLNGTTSQRITERETEHRDLARRAAGEGFVLLRNRNGVLPISTESAIGLYGAGAVKTVKGGTGSGDVNDRESVSIYQGLQNAGYSITSGEWLEAYETVYNAAREQWKEEILKKLEVSGNFFESYSRTPFYLPAGNSIDERKAAADGADTAVFVLSRIAGENADRRVIPGDYLISEREKALLGQLSRSYTHVILIINAGGVVDLKFTDEYPNIDAILYYVQAGQEGGNALADVLCGKVTPSGKLVDSWAEDYEDYPNAATFSHRNGNVETELYEEGIYVGYRYFDTFDVPVRYCFGYGLSYTEFMLETESIALKKTAGCPSALEIHLRIQNTGETYAGKEVAQIYVSCPQEGLVKEYRRLAGFGKTRELKPQEMERMSISISLEQLASYNEQLASWVLEKGTYGIWMGDSLENAALIGTMEMDGDAVLTQCENICPLRQSLDEKKPSLRLLMDKEAEWKEEARHKELPTVYVKAEEISTRQVRYSDMKARPLDQRAGEIVESLSTEQLIQMATGELKGGQANMLGSAGITIPGAAAETSKTALAKPWEVASIALADGPAGIRLNQSYQVEDGRIIPQNFTNFERGLFAEKKESAGGTTYYQYCTAIPVGTLLAQSWNLGLMEELGELIGREMELFQVTLWLAPGMNIHRNPLCGRNFEYYSEDPLIAGLMASAMTRGVQKRPGCGTTIKHFACNNQEDNRMGSDSVISERALREIYLKGFEIAVKDSQPMAIMTSYNMINGIHAANCYDLCTKAARDEWGFAGAIMTDWTTTSSPRGECTASGCMRAGNDMVMPGNSRDHENLRQELKAGTLDIRELKRCVWNTVRIILQSNQYEEARSYLEQFKNLGAYMKAITLDRNDNC